jgi:hypothetical protein
MLEQLLDMSNVMEQEHSNICGIGCHQIKETSQTIHKRSIIFGRAISSQKYKLSMPFYRASIVVFKVAVSIAHATFKKLDSSAA